MALSSPAMTALADACIAASLQEAHESAEATTKFWECSEKVNRGEMTVELIWSDESDLSYVFTPVT